MAVQTSDSGLTTYTVDDLKRGAWTHASLLSVPAGYAPVMTNFDLPGGVPTAMYGDVAFISTAWPDDSGVINLLCDRRIAGSAPVIILGTTAGIVYYWTGAAWTRLRSGLDTTATTWWSYVQYGTDLFISNPVDGVHRYDGDTLVPIGAKPIAQMESDEASLWAGETADTTNYREGTQGMYVESSGAQTTMTYTPSSNFDAVDGRLSAADYVSDKSPGTDFYHFKAFFTNTGTIDTTNTRVLLTDGDGDSLNFPYTTWDSDRDGTAMPAAPTVSTWYDVYLPAVDGTETATFNAANIDTFAFAVDTSAGTLRMSCDDFYVIYNNTMPAVQYLAEWKNILVGARTTANVDTYFFSKQRAPDEYDTNANAPIKARGEAITGLKKFYNQLVIGADHSVHSLSGSVSGQTYPAYLFDVQEVTDEAGVSSHRSMIKANNKLWWWYQREIVAYNGTGVEKKSYPVDVDLATVDDNVLQFNVGERFRAKNQLWWTWRRSGQSVNDRVMRYDYMLDAWLPTTGLPTPVLLRTFSSGVERLLTTDATDRTVYRQDNQTPGYQFAGTDISYTLELPPMTSHQAQQWVDAYIPYLTNTGSIVVAYRIADHLRALSGASYTTLETINQAVAGELGKVRIGDRATLCQLRITGTAVAMQLQPPFIVTAQGQGIQQRFP